jgi:hypothetical protein
MFKRYNLILLSVFMLLLVSGVYAQTTCLLVSEESGPYANDVPLKEWLESKDILVDIATGDEVNTGFYTREDFKDYDFVFVSESISSSDGDSLKGAPVPIFTTELWGSKWDINGWVPNNTSVTYYENSTTNTVRIVDGSHYLAAGFATDAEIVIATDTDDTDAGNYTTYSVPQVDHIPIAVLTDDDTRVVVMGVEAGTALYEAQKADGEYPDGSVVSENRVAAVGINALANPYLTDDTYKLIEAGINWILHNETAIDENNVAGPVNFKLEQNYPNPFNPSTNISFTLSENVHTLIKVYNILGQEVATLVNENLNAGPHTIQFNGSDLESGLYFYTIIAGDYQASKKMMLIK